LDRERAHFYENSCRKMPQEKPLLRRPSELTKPGQMGTMTRQNLLNQAIAGERDPLVATSSRNYLRRYAA
jgi:hypothetical protein